MQSSDDKSAFSLLRLIARFTSGMSRLAAVALTVLAVLAAVPLVGALADWLVKQREGTSAGVRSFLWKNTGPPPNCVGTACAMATLPLATYQQAGGNNSTAVAAVIDWPAPQLLTASSDSYYEMVGNADRSRPTVERIDRDSKRSDSSADEPANNTRSIQLGNEVQPGGNRRPITVDTEGFISAWTEDGAPALNSLTPWSRPAPNPNDHTQQAAIERKRQWMAMKVRSLQYQPVPTQLALDVLRAAVTQQIASGDVMVFDWQDTGVLDGLFTQVAPARSMLGLVTQVQEIGQHQRLSVYVPRSSLYSGGRHWISQRLGEVPIGSPVLPSEVNALFFKPMGMLGATPSWEQMERSFQKLPRADVLRAPGIAADPGCVEPALPSNACVWVQLHGVAVPVQVSVLALTNGNVALTERAVFAGKAIRAEDWAAMPRAFRREFGSPSELGTAVSRKLLSGNTKLLIAPQPWLKAGLRVSLAQPRPVGKP